MIYKLSDKLLFGKYKGQKLKQVIENDPYYIDWAYNEIIGFDLTKKAEDYLYNVFDCRTESDRGDWGDWHDMH